VILIIDCANLCYMAYHAIKEDLSYNESQTGVMFGFFNQLFRICWEFNTGKVIFAWDSRKSYRRDLYSKYKRPDTEPDPQKQRDRAAVVKQIDKLRTQVIPTLGFKNSFIQTGLEADDIMAHLVINNVPGATIISSDQDLYQLLDHCVVYSPRTRKRIDKAVFGNMFQIEPEQWVDVKALAGCESDNVSGISGVGLITAIKYINERLPNGKAKKKIESEEGKEVRRRNEALVKLPFMPNKMDFAVDFEAENKSLDDWMGLFGEYGFKHFQKKTQLEKIKACFFGFS